MLNTKSRTIAALIMSFFLANAGLAQTNELGWTLDSALKQIEHQAESFESAMADFDAAWQNRDGEVTAEASGRIYLTEQGDLRLNIVSPESRQLLLDGKYLYDYRPDNAIVEKFYLPKHSKLIQFARLGFTQTGRDLKDNFLVTLLGEDRIGNQRVVGLELTPKKDDLRAVVARIQVWIDQASWVPARQVIFHVSSGDNLTLNYSGISTNLNLNKDLFKPKWPRGTETVKR